MKYLLVFVFCLFSLTYSYSQLNEHYYTDTGNEIYNPAFNTYGATSIHAYHKTYLKHAFQTYNSSAINLYLPLDSIINNFTVSFKYMGSYVPNNTDLLFNGGLSYCFSSKSFMGYFSIGANAGVVNRKISYLGTKQKDNVPDFNIGASLITCTKRANCISLMISYNHINKPTLFKQTLGNKYSYKPFMKTSVIYHRLSPNPSHNWEYAYNGYFLNNSLHVISITDILNGQYRFTAGVSSNKDIFFSIGLGFSNNSFRLKLAFIILNDKTIRNQLGNGIEESFSMFLPPL